MFLVCAKNGPNRLAYIFSVKGCKFFSVRIMRVGDTYQDGIAILWRQHAMAIQPRDHLGQMTGRLEQFQGAHIPCSAFRSFQNLTEGSSPESAWDTRMWSVMQVEPTQHALAGNIETNASRHDAFMCDTDVDNKNISKGGAQ